ncbi:MAG: recombinase zinc beta ribbon domain-containing protein [Mycobacterium sp.]
MLLNPERTTNFRAPTKRLLTGLIRCGVCGASMQSRPRDDHTKRYVCAGRRAGHQLAIVADAADAVVAERVLALLVMPQVRRALAGAAGSTSPNGELGQALADLGSAQGRLQALDDDYYVHGVLAESRYRPVKAKLEREVDRLRKAIDLATKQRVALDPDPPAYWASADIVQRRELVRLVVAEVTISPARRGVPRFDPTRVHIELLPGLSEDMAPIRTASLHPGRDDGDSHGGGVRVPARASG